MSDRPFRFTRGQYHRLGELGFFDGKRVELIRGEIIEMSPKNWPHVVSCRKTGDVVEGAFAGIGWVSRQEPIDLTDSEPEPDVAVYAGRFEDYTDHPTTALLIVEVADTTLNRDTTTKAEVYAGAGIADYWVVDLIGRRLLVFRDPEQESMGMDANAYRTRLTFGPNESIAPLASPSNPVKVSDLMP